MSQWQRIVADHGSAVFGVAWRVLGNAADAEDVAQDVFLEAFREFRSTAVRSWPALLRRLATFRALDHLRQRRALSPLDAPEPQSPSASPQEEASGRELADRLRLAVAQLAPREAEVFCLRFFEDIPNSQIAEALDMTPGAVAVALRKARQRLESILMPAHVKE
jgi:RNA polymerase sigma-70 factor (ECF subfamily)